MKEEFDDVVDEVLRNKKYVVKLKYNDVIKYRKHLYSLGFQEWKINLLWDYIWDYIDYGKMMRILYK